MQDASAAREEAQAVLGSLFWRSSLGGACRASQANRASFAVDGPPGTRHRSRHLTFASASFKFLPFAVSAHSYPALPLSCMLPPHLPRLIALARTLPHSTLTFSPSPFASHTVPAGHCSFSLAASSLACPRRSVSRLRCVQPAVGWSCAS